MFKEMPRHDWKSPAADVHRYAAIDEKCMANELYTPPPVSTFKPYYPQLGF